MSRKTIIILIITIFIFGVGLYSAIYLVRSQGCVDGRGTDYYFEKTELTRSCSIKTYRIKANWRFTTRQKI